MEKTIFDPLPVLDDPGYRKSVTVQLGKHEVGHYADGTVRNLISAISSGWADVRTAAWIQVGEDSYELWS